MKLVEKSTIVFSNLSLDQFCKRITDNPKAVLLDVRTKEEFNGTIKDKPSFGSFKNAINIPIDELESRMKELRQYKDQEILVYCSHSHRSPRAAYLLSTSGFKQVKNMSGGVSVVLAHLSDECVKKNFQFHIGE